LAVFGAQTASPVAQRSDHALSYTAGKILLFRKTMSGPNRFFFSLGVTNTSARAASMDRVVRALVASVCLLALCSCAPRIVDVNPREGKPATTVNVAIEYLVGWPRVEIGNTIMDWPQLKLMAAQPARKDVPGEDLVWIEDKILQFTIPDLPPGDYDVTIHDDKGPPGDLTYSFLETTAYVAFPPVWPFVFRSNQAQFKLRVLSRD
jgi:hypothetical protein